MNASVRAFRRARRDVRGQWWIHTEKLPPVTLAQVLDYFGPTLSATTPELADVDLDRIVGTIARPGDFDRNLHPIARHLEQRWAQVHHARTTGTDLGCISLVQAGDLYLISDGHHRASVARSLGQLAINACIRRLCTTSPACLDCLDPNN